MTLLAQFIQLGFIRLRAGNNWAGFANSYSAACQYKCVPMEKGNQAVAPIECVEVVAGRQLPCPDGASSNGGGAHLGKAGSIQTCINSPEGSLFT